MNRLGWIGLAALMAAGCQEQRPGMWEGPAVPAARNAARNVRPGHIVQFPFTPADVAYMVGLDGESYVARLPESAPASNPPYFAIQEYQKGRPLGPVKFEERYVPGYKQTCRAWLVDVAGLGDPFPPPNVTPAAKLTVRVVGLDDRGYHALQKHIDAEPAPAGKPQPYFCLIGGFKDSAPEIAAGQAILVGCWFQTDPQVRFDKGIFGVAESSPRAYVIYIRFGRGASTTRPATAPAGAGG